MTRKVVIVIVAAAVVVMVATGFMVKTVLTNLSSFMAMGSSSTYQDVRVQVPKETNNQTLAVFNFRPQGEPNAEFYSIGFARALADRLYCAPTAVTQQMSIGDITACISARKLDYRRPIADTAAVSIGKQAGVVWVVTGDLTKSGDNLKLAVKLTDTRSGKSIAYEADGKTESLPALQTQLIGQIVKGMDLKPTPDQLKEVLSPNFSSPRTLELYGRSFLSKNMKQCEAYRWSAFDLDPGAFSALRLLEFYAYGPSTIPEVRSNKRLAALWTDTGKRFAANSHIRAVKGLILIDQCRYADAETLLRKLTADDPNFIQGHAMLACVACCRADGELQVAECKRLVGLWQNNPYFHASLAAAYNLGAGNARRGNYFSNMSAGMRSAWDASSSRALDEAVIAVRMDRDCDDGWRELQSVGLQLGRRRDVDTAFAERIRINPQNEGAYRSYATCFTPQWGGSESDRQRVYSKAEAAFGKDSPEVCAIRASTIEWFPVDVRPREEALRYVELGLKRNPTSPGLQSLKSRLLFGLKRYDESEALTAEGAKKWDTLSWRFFLARCYCMDYQRKGDLAALDKAERIFAQYAHELPNDVEAYNQWGWCLSHQGHRAEAKAKFLKALQLDPENENAKRKLQYVQ